MPKLIIQLQGQESVVDLQTGSNTIGRQSSNIVPVQDSTLSRLHCEILLEGRTATLVDKGSRNGTLLNGRKVATQVLNPGDKISIGATLIWFEQKNVAEEQKPAPEAPVPLATPAPSTRRVRSVPAAEAVPTPEALRDYACFTPPGIGAGRIAAGFLVLALLGGAGYGARRILNAPAGPAVDLENMLARNGSFDRSSGGRAEGWTLRAGISGERPVGAAGVDPARGRNGGPCLFLDKSSGTGELLGECAWQDDLPLGRGGAVEASAWVQFDGFTGWAALKVEWLKSPRGAVLAEEYSDPVRKSAQWSPVGGIFTAPPGAGAFRFALAVLGRSGRVFFDDVSVKLRQGGGPAAERKVGPHRILYTKQGLLQAELRGGRRSLVNIGCRLESEKEGATPQAFATEVTATAEEGGLLFQGRLVNPLDFREVPFEQRVSAVEGHGVVVYQFRGDALKQTDRFSVVLTLPRVESLRGLPEPGGVTSRVTCSGEEGDFAIEYLDPARVVSRTVDGRLRLTQTWSVDPQSEDPVFGFRIRESGGGGGPLDPLQKIAELRQAKKSGEALAFIKEVVGKTKEAPVREKMESELRQLEDALKREWADLQSDAFRARISRQGTLVTRALDSIEQFVRRWSGEGSELKAEQLRQEIQKDLAAVSDPASERARRILDRAKQCAAGERRTLAQVLLQTLLGRYPSSEAAQEAQQLLKTLKAP